MNKAGLVIGLIVLVAVAGGAYALTQNSDEPASTKTTQTDTHADHSHETTADTSQAVETSTITYTDDGFNPSVIKVKAGTTVTVKNESSHPLEFSSGPHPQHTDDEELNLSTLSPGKSTTLVVTVTGTHSFHNHLSEDDSGTLIVE